jgi:hypothetical protein
MITFSLQSNLDEVAKRLDDVARRQLPYATMRALNKTAFEIQQDVYATMQRKFDRPTPYTLRSMRLERATKHNLATAAVALKDDSPGGKGTPWVRALGHQFTGGTREWTRFEGTLLRVGILPRGLAAVPAAGARRNAYGNVSPGLLVQLLSYFHAFGEQGYRANMSAARKAKLERRGQTRQGFATIRGVAYFVSHGQMREGKTRHLAPGIWSMSGIHGAKVRPVILFVRRPRYRARIDLNTIARWTVVHHFDRHFAEALTLALRTAHR